jgi:hypothetical protein
VKGYMVNELDEMLRDYKYFQECVILEFRIKHYQTTVELLFDYIWTQDGEYQPIVNATKLAVIFRVVQEIHVHNDLNDTQVLNPEAMNWGMNEISWIRIRDDEKFLKPYKELPITFHHAAISWENGRRIDIVFSELEIVGDL